MGAREGTSPLALLVAARAILSGPERWTQNADARTAAQDGLVVTPMHGHAGCWCLTGAVRLAEHRTGAGMRAYERAVGMLESEIKRRGQHPIAPGGIAQGWNDMPDRTYTDVTRLLDYVIAEAEAR